MPKDFGFHQPVVDGYIYPKNSAGHVSALLLIIDIETSLYTRYTRSRSNFISKMRPIQLQALTMALLPSIVTSNPTLPSVSLQVQPVNGPGDTHEHSRSNFDISTSFFPLAKRDALPANVPATFWDDTKPPSANINSTDNLVFEVLHCDKKWKYVYSTSQAIKLNSYFSSKETQRAGGDCHYTAGQLAKGSEFHLWMYGTEAVIASCHLEGRISFVGMQASPDVMGKTRNGLCAFHVLLAFEHLKIVN